MVDESERRAARASYAGCGTRCGDSNLLRWTYLALLGRTAARSHRFLERGYRPERTNSGGSAVQLSSYALAGWPLVRPTCARSRHAYEDGPVGRDLPGRRKQTHPGARGEGSYSFQLVARRRENGMGRTDRRRHDRAASRQRLYGRNGGLETFSNSWAVLWNSMDLR